MSKKLIGIIALTCSFLFCQATFADSACHESLSNMVSSIKLDDAQKEKIKPILEQLKAGMKEKGAQMHELDAQIKQQVHSATMDQNVVNGLIDKKAQMIGDMMKAKSMAVNQILAVLNDTQKKAIEDKMKKLEEKMAAMYKSCHDQD